MGSDPNKTRLYRVYLKIRLIIDYSEKWTKIQAVPNQNPDPGSKGVSEWLYNDGNPPLSLE